MPPTLKDFTARLEEKREEERQRMAASVTQARQAAVKADLLMQHEGWDYFLSVLQAKLEEAKQNEVEWMQRAAQAILDQDRTMAQINYFIWKERVTLLEEVIMLPSQMRGQAAQNGPAGNPAHKVEGA